MPDQAVVSLSQVDTDRFGIPIARSASMTSENLNKVLDYCRTHHIKMLIARCAAADLSTVQQMEQAGFRLMDTLVYYGYDLVKKPLPELPTAEKLRAVGTGEEPQVEAVARVAFKDYYGHYHADPRLDKQKCDEGYIAWAVRSCTSRDVADEVLVGEVNDQIVSFATLRQNSPEEAEGVLFGVAPAAQGHGMYRRMMVNGLHWSQARNAKRMVVSTQITNLAVQKVWCRLGFEPSHAFYSFHKWFD